MTSNEQDFIYTCPDGKHKPLEPKWKMKKGGYEQNIYQYATTSHQSDKMRPNEVIYPRSVEDIIKVVKKAAEVEGGNVGIAVRTGGHQYSGASSTAGRNIQIDLSDTFQDPTENFVYDNSKNLLKVGVSYSLNELNTLLAKEDMFLPGTISLLPYNN